MIPIIIVKIKCRIYQSRWEKNFILVFSFFFMITPYRKELVLTLYFLLYQNISSSVRHVDRIAILHPSRKPAPLFPRNSNSNLISSAGLNYKRPCFLIRYGLISTINTIRSASHYNTRCFNWVSF